MMQSLILHPQCPAGSIARIDAEIEATATGCHVVFVATGDVSQIKVPAVEADRGRHDYLWKTTCLEVFWQPAGGTAYREFNLSPSTRWACYDFDDFRSGMRDAPAVVDIDVSVGPQSLRLETHIESDLPHPASVALNGIIEGTDGINRFWALAFADGAPEFHNDICRAWQIA